MSSPSSSTACDQLSAIAVHVGKGIRTTFTLFLYMHLKPFFVFLDSGAEADVIGRETIPT